MRKILIIICCITAINHSFAQTIKFDIEAGANTSAYAEKESALTKGIPDFVYTTDNTVTEGFHAGLLAKTTFGNWSLQTGALYTTKGGDDHMVQLTAGQFRLEQYGYRKLQYTEIPLNVTYNIPFDDYNFFIGGGPYAEIIIKGNYDEIYNYTGYPVNGGGTLNVGALVPGVSYGIHLLEGVEFKNGFSFNVGYELGLTNVAGNGNYIAKNNTVMLSVAYTLFKLKVHHKKSS